MTDYGCSMAERNPRCRTNGSKSGSLYSRVSRLSMQRLAITLPLAAMHSP